MLERARASIVTAIRSLATAPLPAVAAVLTLATAVGLNLAMAGLIDRALLSPAAHVVDPASVVTFGFHLPDDDSSGAMTTTSYVTFTTIARAVPLGAVAAWQRSSDRVMIDGEQLPAEIMMVAGGYFDLLGARATIGRVIGISDDGGAAVMPVAVLSQGFWRSALRGDRAAIGRRLNVRGQDYEIAGVMPDGFSGHSAASVDVWVPMAAAMHDSPGWDRDRFRNVASVIARLAPGQSLAAAATQASAAVDRRVTLSPIVGLDVTATDRRIAWWLTGVAVLVLVVGLANAATLLLVRAARRRREIAIRSALGASSLRFTTEAWIEAALLAGAATGIAIIAAFWLDEIVRRGLFPGLVERSGLRGVTVTAAILCGGLSTLVAGISSTWQTRSLHRVGERDRLTGPHRPRTLTTMLVVQTAMSMVLLAGAGMFGRSFQALAAQDFGLRMNGVILADIEPGPGTAALGPVFEDAIDRVRALPGVERVTVVDALPFSGFNVPPISVPGRASPPAVGRQLPFLNAATPDFLRILGIQVVEGRAFTDADERGAPVVIVNETMAREVWPGERALGKCIRIGFDPDFDPSTAAGPPTPSERVVCREVVGVAKDVRQRSVRPVENETRLMQYFVPYAQVPRPPFIANQPRLAWGLLVKVHADTDGLAAAIRRAIVGTRTDIPFVRVRPYAQLLDRQLRPWRLGTTLLGLFSAVAMAVAALGLYAAFAHAVNERKREMAIRLAVGAQPVGLVRMVLGHAMLIACGGAAAGTLAAIGAGRWVQSLLFGTAPTDPLVLGGAALVMLCVTTIATLAPARSAARTNPTTLLRSE